MAFYEPNKKGLRQIKGHWNNGPLYGQVNITWYEGHKNPHNRKEFVGQFKNDYPEGKGTIIYYDGKKFKGDFWGCSKDDFNATGTMTCPDGRKEVGEFQGRPLSYINAQ